MKIAIARIQTDFLFGMFHSKRSGMRRSMTALVLAAFSILGAWTIGLAESGPQVAHSKALLIRTRGPEEGFIALTRVHEMSVFGPTIGNKDTTTDSYRVIPLFLTAPVRVRVELQDAQKRLRAILVREKAVPAGPHFFVLTYGAVVSQLKGEKRFFLRIRARAAQGTKGATRTQVLEESGCLMEKLSGDVLGNIVVHDVMIHRGELWLNRSDLVLSGRGPSFGFSRTYNNQAFDRRLYTTMGQGWRHVYEKQLTILAVGEAPQPHNLPLWVIRAEGKLLPGSALPSGTGRPRYVRVNGTHFKRIGNRWVACCTRHGSLVEKEDVFEFISKDGTVWGYEKPSSPNLTASAGKPTAALDNDPTGPAGAIRSDLLPDLRFGPPRAWPLRYVKDRNGNRVTLTYARTPIGPVVTSVVDAVGRELKFEYQPDVHTAYRSPSDYRRHPLRLVHVIGPDGIALRFGYEAKTFLLTRYQRDVQTENYAYAPVNPKAAAQIPPIFQHYQLVQVKDANGHHTDYEYCTKSDIPASVLRSVTALDPRQAIKRVIYPDCAAAVIQYDPTTTDERVVFDLRGHPTRYLLNEYGNPLKQIEPLGKTTTWTWQLDDARNDILMRSQTDSRGLKVTYAYDRKGNVVRQKDSNGNTTVNEWLPKTSELLSQICNGKRVLAKRYDDRGNLISSVDAKGTWITYRYNRFGQCSSESHAGGGVVTYTYDRWGNLRSMRSASGAVTHYQYDIRGRLRAKTTADGRRWAYTYDTLDRPVETKEPGKPSEHNRYDAKGNLLKKTIGGIASVSYAYDSRDRVVRMMKGGQTYRFTYDANSNLLSVSRKGIEVARHRYNALNKEITSRNAANGLDLRCQSLLKELSAGIRLPKQLATATEEQRRAAYQAASFNRLGVYFFNRDDIASSLPYFKRAVELSNHSISFLRNCMQAYNALEQYPQALAFLEAHWQPYRQDAVLRSWDAWLLKRTGQPRAAVKTYARLFSEGYRNDEDFKIYTDTLQELKMDASLDKAFTQYLKGGTSESILLLKAISLRKRRKHDDALAILNALQRSTPFDPKVSYEIIHNYFELAQYRKARQVCQRMIAKGHASADAYYLKGRAEYQLQRLSEAKASLEKALSFTPEDNDIKSFIDQIAAIQGQGRNREIKKVIDPVTIPAAMAGLLSEKGTLSSLQTSDVVYQYRVKCYRFRKGQPLTETLHMKIQVLTPTGVAQMNQLKMDFNPLFEDIHVNQLIVRNQRGAVIAKGDPDEYYVMDAHPEDSASYNRTLYVPVPHLSPGAVIEWTVTRRTKDPCDRFPFEREVLFGAHPTCLAGLYVQGDTKSILYTAENTAPPRRVDGGWLWVERNQRAYTQEPKAASFERFRPVVRLGAAGQTWKEVGQVYCGRIGKVLVLDDHTRNLSRSLVDSIPSPQDKIDRLARFVQTDLTYQGIEFGTRGMVPNRATVILHRKYGDCKDHAVLLHQLLTAAGLKAKLALVNTGAMVDPKLPSVNQFNHMIVCVTLNHQLQFIDATDKGLKLGLATPDGLAGRRVLLLDPQHSHLVRIPGYAPSHCHIRCQEVLAMENQTDLLVSEKVIFQGYPAAHMRSFLNGMEKSRRPAWFQELLGAYYPSAHLNSVDFEHLRDTTADLVINMRYTIGEGRQKPQKTRRLTVPSLWEQYYLKIRPVWQRTSPFEIAYPIQFDTVVTLPRHAEFTTIDALPPEERHADTPFCSWKLGLQTVRAHHRQLCFRLKLSTGVFPSSDYATYRSTMASALSAVNRGFICQASPAPL
jgi:YD repeat-containing protein